MTIKIYDPSNNALGFLNNVFDLKITKEISGMEEMSFYVPINSYEASLIQLEGYVYPEDEQLFVIREVNQHGNDIEVFCTLAIENLYGYCWEAITKKSISLVDAFEYAMQYTGWKFVNRSSKPATTRDIHIQNQTVWEALQVLCEVFFVELIVDTHTHTITVYDKVGEDTGTFFISDMNLVNFRKDMSTHKLITRLIPIGKDGLRISSVNGGKEYIDNNKYSSKLLYGLWIQTAYTNPQQLKEDATKMLEEYAKPYVTYNVDIVDLYRKTGNPLFKFNIGDTVTLIDKLSEEKAQQRVVKMEIYPHNPQLNNIELSNKNKTFQDYFKMIQLMNNMANHFISTNGSYTGTGDSNINKSPSADSVGNVHIQDGSISTDKIQANSITTDKLVANSITTDKLQANSIATNHLQANSVTTDKLQANSISTDKLQANSISTDKLQANSITSNKIQAKSIKAEHLQSNIIDSDKIFADAITSDKIQAGAITTEKLDSNVVNTNHLIANSITADKIKAQNITTDHLQAGSVTADKIGANSVTADKIKAGAIESGHIKADAITGGHIQSDSINSGHIKADVITTEHLQSGSITAGSGIIANGAIGDAQISNITAGKITSGTIDTSKVTVSGANSNLKISGNRLQVFNGTGSSQVERVSIGDVNGNGSVYGLRVRGADGKTILLDENGVKSEGITDGSITNSKISDSAQIDGEKLNINSVVNQINKDGTTSIKGVKVLVNNTNLETSLSNITTKQTEHTNKITQHESSIKANQDAIKLKVDTQTYTTDKSNMTTQMNKNTSAISVLEKEIELKVEQTDINTAVNKVTGTIDSKINTAKAEIKATTDAITQRVQSTETTTTTLQNSLTDTSNKLANLNVGGRNLLPFSRLKFSGCTVNSGKSTEHIDLTTNGDKYDGIYIPHTLVEPGEKYVLSYDLTLITADGTVGGHTGVADVYEWYINGVKQTTKYSSSVPLAKNTKVRIEIYFTAIHPDDVSNGTNIYIQVQRGVTTPVAMNFIVDNIKLEKGNKPTDWTPSPEDVQTQIDAHTSEISTTKNNVATLTTSLNSITQKVQSTETTTKKLQTDLTNTTSKIDNLKLGSNNLLTNSRLHKNYDTWECSNKSSVSFTTEDGKPCGKVNHTALKVSTVLNQSVIEKLIPGETYTISGWVKTEYIVKGTTNYIIGFYADGYYNNNGTSTWFGAEPSSNRFPVNTGEGEWEHVHMTFVFPKDKGKLATSFKVCLYCRDFTGQVYFRDIKLELGNKPTDWTPAQEDFQTQIDSNKSEISTTKSKVATVETNLSGITSRVSNVETKTTTLDGKVTAQEARIKTAESKITDSAIINTVSSTIDNKVNAGIDNLDIGGRNLVRNSAFINGSTGWKLATNVTIDTSNTFNGHPTCKSAQSGLTANSWRGCLNYGLPIAYGGDFKAGEVLTYSCWYYIEDTSTFDKAIVLELKGKKSGATSESGLGTCRIEKDDLVQGKWTRMIKTVTLSQDFTDCCIRAWVEQNGTVWFADFKLEKGNKVTDWSPAPEDIESKVDSQYSELKQTADSITATVSDLNGKYTQIKQTVDSIDLTGKVSFSDLSTKGKTTINGANITTGTINANLVQGGTIKGALLQTYANDSTKGVRIAQESMLLNNTSFFYNTGGDFNIQSKEGFNIGSMQNIYIMPGLNQSGVATGSGEFVVPSATTRLQKLNVVNDASVTGTLTASGGITSGGNIKGVNNIQLGRTSIYLPRVGSSITTDYLKLGGGYLSIADTGAMHFIPTSGSTNMSWARGSVWLPGANGSVTTDHFGIGYGIMACVDSGNFHFVTRGGSSASLYAKTTVASYSLDNVIESRSSKKALDIISEVPVVNTEEGYRLSAPKTKSVEATNVSNISIDEESGKEIINTDYNSALATMWKAIQELQQEVNSLKEENKELRHLLNKEEFYVSI